MKKLLYSLLVLFVMMICCSCFEKYETVSDDECMSIKLSDDIQISMKKISAGSFKMGTYEGFGEEDELPVRDVTITKDYYIGEFEITQKEWEAVMGNNPSGFKGENLPVENVKWGECMEFCEKLSKKTGLNISLPTEAQWEYACRAGSETKWFFGDDEVELGKYASMEVEDRTVEVGSFEPNPNGLYDVYGNVMEWCLDYYSGEYPKDDLTDPTGAKEGEARVSRGGGWGAGADCCRSAYRNASGENVSSDGIGFRIVVNS